jgi:hypothetical protein
MQSSQHRVVSDAERTRRLGRVACAKGLENDALERPVAGVIKEGAEKGGTDAREDAKDGCRKEPTVVERGRRGQIHLQKEGGQARKEDL